MQNTLHGLRLLMLVALIAGCGRGATATNPAQSSGGTDQTEVASQVAANPEYVEDGLFESEAVTEAAIEAGAGLGVEGTAAAIRPLRFWRHITDVRRSFEFAFADTDSTGRPTRAVVTVHKALAGTFNIAVAPPRDSGLTRPRVIQKRLADHWTRRLLLHRVRVPGFDRPQWRIVATSLVEVDSRDKTTDLVSLRVQSDGGLDTTITDPLAFFHLRRVLRFADGDSVRLTATTLRDDDVVVLQHADRRFRFRNNGDHTYTGVFRARLFTGMRHVGIDALSHGTLFDDQAPYDSEAWILPYVSRPIQLAFDD